MYGRRDLELIRKHNERLLREADRRRLVKYLGAARRKVHPPVARSYLQDTQGSESAAFFALAGPAR